VATRSRAIGVRSESRRLSSVCTVARRHVRGRRRFNARATGLSLLLLDE
jgi:hypothetical protein